MVGKRLTDCMFGPHGIDPCGEKVEQQPACSFLGHLVTVPPRGHGPVVSLVPNIGGMAQPPEPWIERTLREAAEAGEFDDLPGKGKPISDIDLPYDANWWVRRWWEKNRALDQAAAFSAVVQRRLPVVMARSDEAGVRAGLEEINEMIAGASGAADLAAVPIDEMVAAWLRRRSRDRPWAP